MLRASNMIPRLRAFSKSSAGPTIIDRPTPSKPLSRSRRIVPILARLSDRESVLSERTRRIQIAAALLTDAHGRLLLVRKSGTAWFMQPGGKIEPGEQPFDALRRELLEELRLTLTLEAPHSCGSFCAPAANEPGFTVEATLFALSLDGEPRPAAEIAEIAWLEPGRPITIPLAPLTRDHALPLWRSLLTEISR
jgi:8-oxo-dGTP diphosphatase